MELFIILVLLVVLIIVGIGVLSFYTVPQQRVAIIERFGRFVFIADPGLHFKIPVVDQIAGKPSLKVLQLENLIDTKTKDNVFVACAISVQFQVDKQNIKTAFYELATPSAQITAYIEDALRASIPTLTLDEAFEKKDDIAEQVQETVAGAMSQFGYVIIRTLITGIEPDASIREAMNGINEAQRRRVAAQELAEAEKIAIVVRAQAEAEQMKLRGEGIANQRKAIVDGLAASAAQLRNEGLSENAVMSVLLMNQYLDSLNKFAEGGGSSIFLPNSPTGYEDMRTAMLSVIEANNHTSKKPN